MERLKNPFFLGVSSLVLSFAIFSFATAQSLTRINFLPQASDPVTCNASNRGGLYFSSSTGELKVCNGSWSAIGGSGTNYFTLSGTSLYPTSTAYMFGVATTTPGYNLTVDGTGYFSGTVKVGTPTVASDAATKTYVDTAVLGAGTNYFTLSGTSLYPTSTAYKLGIGTTTPSQTLSVVGTSTFSGRIGLGIVTTPTASLQIEAPSGVVAVRLKGEASSVMDTLILTGYNNVVQWNIDGIGIQTFSGNNGHIKINTTPWSIKDIYGGANLQIAQFGGAFSSGGFVVTTDRNWTYTSGEHNNANITGTFAPTSGTGTFNGWVFSNTINQTGGADGITRGVYINPTLTSASNFRAIETERGDVRIGTTSGNVGIGIASATALTTKFAIKASSTSANDSALNITNSNNASLLYVQNDGMIGVGTTTLTAKLVLQTSSSVTTDYALKILDSANSETVVINNKGYIGIASSSPGYYLTVNGTGYFSQPITVGTPTDASHAATKAYVDSAAGTNWILSAGRLYPSSTGWSVGIATTTFASSTYKLVVAGDVLIGDGVGTDLVVGPNGTGKIDAGTIDPIYTIGGTRYATYMAGMTGVKEETTGQVSVKCKVKGEKCSTIIDFKNLKEGSDLWLFSRTANIKKNFSRMVALLTPAFDGRVWYEKDEDALKLTIYGTQAGEVSYRLTAPRFDFESWSNRPEDGEHAGFNLDLLILPDGRVLKTQ